MIQMMREENPDAEGDPIGAVVEYAHAGPDLGCETPAADQAEDLGRRVRDVGAGAIDRGHAGLAQEIVVLGRDDAAATTSMSRALAAASASISWGTRVLWPAAWVETPMTWTSFSIAWRAASSGRLEQGPDIDVEADIGKGGGDHLGAAVMSVLAQLHHQHARPPAAFLGEGGDILLDAAELRIAVIGGTIDAGDRPRRGAMAGEDLFQRGRNFADRGARAHGIDGERQQIGLARGTLGQRLQAPPRPWRDCARP